jgi:hypothetical protein
LEKHGFVVETRDGFLWTKNCNQLHDLAAQAITIDPHSLSCDSGGFLTVQRNGDRKDPRGYLQMDMTPQMPEDIVVPVRFLTEGTTARLQVMSDMDGQALPEKIGGSWYVPLSESSLRGSHAHAPDFRGTIGLRCAAPLNPSGIWGP